jgi:hypothetical protein
MSEDGFKAPPVKGYQDVSGDKLTIVNQHKEIEERILRQLDLLKGADVDQRWLAIGRTKMEEAWMAINRAVFQPQRVKLSEDAAPRGSRLRGDAHGPRSPARSECRRHHGEVRGRLEATIGGGKLWTERVKRRPHPSSRWATW